MSRPLYRQMSDLVWDSALPDGLGKSKNVLLCYCHHFNDLAGASFPGMARVAKMCGISVRAVQNHVRALERARILLPRTRRGLPTRYGIDLSSLTPIFPEKVQPVDNLLDAVDNSDFEGATPADFAATPAESSTLPQQIETATLAESVPKQSLTAKTTIRTADPALPDAVMMVDGVNPQVLADFAAIRAKKKLGALNATALEVLCSEAAKAGLTLAQVLTTCCARNWGRFEAAWLTEASRSPASSASMANTTVPAPPAGPPPEPLKPAAPEVAAAGRQRLQEIRKTMLGAPAMPAGDSDIRIAPDAPGWAVALVNKAKSGQFVTNGVLRGACLALKIDPAKVRRAQAGPAGLAAGRVH
jgi:hypothetical protein